jgi:hypothetical protein
MYPVAWAVVEQETGDTWEWFLGLLIKDLDINDSGAGWIFANIETPTGKILLNNILHVPDASKNLLSVNRIAFDNHAYVDFWSKFFLIKDQVTKKVVHRGKCRGGSTH